MTKRSTHAAKVVLTNPHKATVHSLFQAALKHHEAGRLQPAELLYRNVIAQEPNHAFALSNLGVLLRGKHQLKEAIALQRRAIAANPRMASAHNNLGNALAEQGSFTAAKTAFRHALTLKPDYTESALGLAGMLSELGEADEAIAVLEQLLERAPNLVTALELLGRLLVQRKDHTAALPYLTRALELAPSHAGVLNNLGVIWSDRGEQEKALAHFQRALEAAPQIAQCHLNVGNMLRDLHGPRAAVPYFQRAVDLDPAYVKGWFNLGSALSRIDASAADAAFQRVLGLKRDHLGALVSSLLHAERNCDFSRAQELQSRLEGALEGALADCTEWNVLSNIAYASLLRPMDDRLVRRVTGRINALLLGLVTRQSPLAPPASPMVSSSPRRIRLGYLSPNFRDHAVGHVTLSLFSAHDRQRFEVHAFSTNQGDLSEDPYYLRHRSGFDAFHSIGALGPRAAAQAIRQQGIDILVDLDGYMENRSPPILAFRPAPIQVFWLGHAGGLGLDCVDYLVADPIVMPPGDETRFREQVVRLPEIYHCADRADIAPEAPGRAAFGLPEAGFVFCAFNNPQKIDRGIFERWMMILRRTEGSCLWLSNPRDNSSLLDSLRREAQAMGVDPARLVFSSRIADKSAHLARHRHADLFLDTITLNASTTALDALWSGLPLLTVKGDRFASRISSTMLHGLGLDDLVMEDLNQYEEQAVRFATDRALLESVRQRLHEARLTRPLFDIKRFTKHLEQAYETLWARAVGGESPRGFSFEVSASNRPVEEGPSTSP